MKTSNRAPRSEPIFGRKPEGDEIDVFGLTHPGKVRDVNEDQFLICSLNKSMDVHLTSLPEVASLPLQEERLAFLAMVADGVGKGGGGAEASRGALEILTRYMAEGVHTYYTADASDDEAFTRALTDATLRCHADLVERARESGESMATTLTLWIGLWPVAYLVQVGDSRYYLFRDGELTQVSRDQTLAQDLLEQGVFSRADTEKSPLADVLSSSIGGSESRPVVTRIEQDWGRVHLLCTDGLTKHVSDERIRERLDSMTSAEQVCRDLLQDALDGGGSDNITIIVGRGIRKRPE